MPTIVNWLNIIQISCFHNEIFYYSMQCYQVAFKAHEKEKDAHWKLRIKTTFSVILYSARICSSEKRIFLSMVVA